MIAPAVSGPKNATNRGALNPKLTAVARMRVGYASGSQVGHQLYWPRVKNALIAETIRITVRLWLHRNRTGVNIQARTNHAIVTGFRPQASAQKPKAMYPATEPTL